MRTAWPLRAILLAIVIASCTSRPGIEVTVAGATAATTYVSDTQRSVCSATVSDAFPQTIALTTVRANTPVAVHVRSAGFVSELRGWIFDDADGRPAGDPLEEFVIRGTEGEFLSQAMRQGGTYNVLITAAWGLAMAGGEESRAFRVRIDAR